MSGNGLHSKTAGRAVEYDIRRIECDEFKDCRKGASWSDSNSVVCLK